MLNIIVEYLPPIVGALVGVALKWGYDYISQKRKFKRELKDNNNIDVSGNWYAAWQTSVNRTELINTEQITIEQKGQTARVWNTEVSPENPEAGYLWTGQMQFLQGRSLMGWYFPKEGESNSSKGIMYLAYLSPKRQFIGKWVGSAYDGELVSGFVVIQKDREFARASLESFIQKHPQDIRLISYEGI